MGRTDEELMRLYQHGRAECFDELLSRYRGPVFSMLHAMLRERDLAEDVFQEVFIKVIRSADTFDTGRRFAPWLFKIADNACLEALRSRKWRTHEPLPDNAEPAAPDTHEPELTLLRNERRKNLADAIARLPDAQRQVILLREFAGLSFSEIAGIMDCPRNTALSHQHRALKRLRDQWPEAQQFAAGRRGRKADTQK